MILPKGTLVGQATKQESHLTSKDVIQLAESLSAALSFAAHLLPLWKKLPKRLYSRWESSFRTVH